jgi:hypothetical protein
VSTGEIHAAAVDDGDDDDDAAVAPDVAMMVFIPNFQNKGHTNEPQFASHYIYRYLI